MKKQENIIKQLIQKASFLNNEDKKEWLILLHDAQPEEKERIRQFFEKACKAEDLYKYKLLHNHKLGKKYAQKLQNLSDSFTRKALQEEEKQK